MRTLQSYRFWLLLSLAGSIPTWAQNPASLLSPAAERLQGYVRFLASPELEGRAAGSEGNRRAAAFIAEHFRRIGLQPVGGSYFQQFPLVTELRIGTATRAEFTITVERLDLPREMWRSYTLRWNAGTQFVPLSFSANGTASGHLVFAGFGISAPERQYDDYEGVDVRGKIVLILRGTPWDERLRSKLVREKLREERHSIDPRYASLRYKISEAERRGAAAVIVVDPQGDSANVLLPLSPETRSPLASIPVIHAQRVEAAKLFPRDRSLYTRELEILRTLKPQSFELPLVQATITVELETIEVEIPNVIGYLRGKDPAYAHEHIILGAHFDHLGWGSFGSLAASREPAIHPGADDNASGTALLMELAERLARQPLPRSVLVIAFNAEEHGVVGSSYYARHPLLPLDSAIAMLNFDMVGRLQDKLILHGLGSSSIWQPLLDSLAPLFGMQLSTVESGFGPSDHTPFHARGLPVLHFFTGLHSDYHRPSDTWEKLNYEGLARIADLAEAILRAIGSRPERPDARRTQAAASSQFEGRLRVRLGVIPDYSDHPAGLRLNGVSAESPAERAGLQADDIIVQLGPYTIRSIYDLMHALQQFTPGDTVTVHFLRNGARKTAQVRFEELR